MSLLWINFLFLFLFLFLSFHFSFYFPPIWPDEILFYSPAIKFAETGIFSTPVMEGLIPGMESYTLWMTPIYLLLLSIVLKLAPGIESARFFSSFIGLFHLILIYLFSKKLKFNKMQVAVFVGLVASDLVFIKIAHTARMEGLCGFFALLSFYFLWTETGKSTSTLNLILGGISLSLSFLSHPFGFVFLFPSLFLIYEGGRFSFRNIIIFTISGLIPLSFWLLYVIPNFEIFLIQFGAQMGRKSDLLGKFSVFTKLKIILSVFKFPLLKLMTLIFFAGLVFQTRKYIKERKVLFGFIWTFTVFIFLYLSSESWYVFHFVTPISFLIAAMILNESKFEKLALVVFFIYNIFILSHTCYNNLKIHSKEKTLAFFEKIQQETMSANTIYLQAIPDPYLFLKDKNPQKKILEFIPGELPIPVEFYRPTIRNQEAFLFYNEDLMNKEVKIFLDKNSDLFERKIIKIETDDPKELKLEAVLYIKKKN